MILNNYIPAFFIGSSFSVLLINKIAFGVFLLIGILLLLINKNFEKFYFNFDDKKINTAFLIMFAFFILSIFNSIYWERSLAVTFYLFVFIMVGLNLFMILIKNPELREKIIKIFLISSLVNICFIFFYSILFIDPLDTVKKFKGFLNIICITVFLLSFFKNEKKYFLPIILIPSSLHINYSYSPCLGIILGTLACIIYFLKKKFLIKKKYLMILTIISVIPIFLFVKALPNQFDQDSIKNQSFEIPTKIIDEHRQFIWGFSVKKIIEKPLFGYGQDSSNFIEGSQKIIGHKLTGNMPFIPSHPHNFLLELILEVGIFGAVSFIIFIFLLNMKIFNECNTREKYYLIFFNGYFWSSSLVNFSFWLSWWQGGYFLLLMLMASKVFEKTKLN